MNGKLVFVMLNDCLIMVKSGNQNPINIGDFMPDYNLWYALKFMQPSIIVILDTPDISRELEPQEFILCSGPGDGDAKYTAQQYE